MDSEYLRKLILEYLPKGVDFEDSDNLISKGLTSLKVMRISSTLRKLGIKVPLGQLMESPTFNRWLQLVSTSQVPQDANSTNTINSSNNSIPSEDTTTISGEFPMTDVQQAYWLGRSDGQTLGGVGCHAYVEFNCIDLDLPRLQLAWTNVLMHHPALRTAFKENLTQTVLDAPYNDRITVHDFSNTPNFEAETLIVREEISHRRLRVELGEVVGLTVLLLPDSKYRVCFDVDLLVADVSSFAIVLRDLETAYSGGELPKASKGWDFAKYLDIQRSSKASELVEDRQYWQSRLQDLPNAPDLPLALRPSEITKTKFTRRFVTLSAEDWNTLKGRASEYSTTPAMLLLTAYVLVLSIWSSRKQFLINIPMFNRNTEYLGIEDAVADFTTLELLAVEVRKGDTFSSLLRRVEKQFHTDMEHTAYSGIRVERDLMRLRDGQEAIAPVVFACNIGTELVDSKFKSTFGSINYMVSQTPQVWLDFQIYEDDGTLLLCWDTVDSLFDSQTLDKMLSSLGTTMHRLVSESWDVNFELIPQEDIVTITNYNHTAQDIPSKLLHQAFIDSAKEYPSNVAVQDADGSITYAELDTLSDRVATYLNCKGVQHGDNVGVLAERHRETIAEILGILKLGAVYVPIDPNNPQARQEQILKDANCVLLLTNDIIPQLPTEVSYIPNNTYSDTAYIIYTSGSTGTPKGVVISHESAYNTIHDINTKFSVDSSDVTIGLSSMCFDLSVYDIFGTLSVGAKLVMVPDIHDVNYIIKTVRQQGITIWNSVPAVMQMVVDTIERELEFTNVSSNVWVEELRLVMLSGDWIPLNLPSRIDNAFPDVEVVSLGGATEASIWSIYYPINEVNPQWSSIPYGMPLANQSIYILDENSNLCPIGTVGEIHIGGVGLAKGYYADLQKTESAFYVHPKLGRLYRTGDFGKFHADGYIEFIGRKDSQVKIRGHRIELGEIEKSLNLIQGVKNATVVVNKDNSKVPILLAYYVSDCEILVPHLKEELAKYVPEYMVPTTFTRIDSIPLTANGKIDRKKLLAMDTTSTITELLPIVTECEKRIESIWRKHIDGLEEVGRNSDFYELGGDSMVIVQVALDIEETLGVHCTHNELLDASTIENQARLVENRLNSGEYTQYEKVIISPEPEKLYEPFALTDVQQAYLLGRGDSFILGGVSNHGYFEYLTKLDIPRFEAALNRVIAAQPMLRCVMVDEQHQRILPELHYTIDTIDAREKSQAEIDSIRQNIREEMSHKVMDAYVCPMFQFKALRITDEESLLFFSIDLLIMDASSVRIFKDQLMEAYSHPENQLPNTDFSFRDFVTGLEHIKNSSTYLKDESYWKGRAKDFSTEATLPLLKPMNQVKKPRYSRLAFKIDTPTWGRLKRTISEHSISPSAVLCTLYLATVAHYSNQESCTVTMTVFNRYDFHPDVDKIIGDFTSTMLIHADFKKDGFWDIAKTVGKDIMEGLEHRSYSGISFTKDLRQAGVLSSKQSIPIVFTSILNNGTEHATMDFGEEQYSVSQTSQVYLDCQAMEINGSLSITWDYVSELLDPTMVSEMFKNFENAIRSIESNEPLNHFENGSVAELVKAYNHTDTYIPCQTLHGAFRNSVTQYPESIAVTDELGSMTYVELDSLSDRVASYLVAKGVQHGDNVGVLAERHKETIAEMLGILKLGAVYVPVDPNNPQARQEQILKDANCVLCLNNDVISQLPTEVSYTPIYDNYCDTAYIIYTSGSTGKPKGVVISHDAVCNTIQDINARFNVSNTDVTIGLSSMCFDLSVYDIFGTLASGGELVIVPNIHDMHHVAELVESKSVTIWNSVPAIMQMYVEVAKRQTTQNSTLRLVMLSGDYIPLTLPDDIKQCCCNTEVISLGGATEASIWSIYYPINEVNPEWKTIPYGMPLANQKFYVLNYDLSLTPAEVEGELYIGGRGLASSYYADPQKTESAYIVHSQLGRLYRTGDFGKFHADGYIEFIGRKDSQVKIRGHRIELGEIEKSLNLIQGVKNATVVVNKDSSKVPILLAYYVANSEIPAPHLKEELAKYVPEYMVPTTFTRIDSIPLTANGKVDRKKLLAMDTTSTITELLPIVTECEKRIESIWRKRIDGLEEVGRNSDFYELGGDSMVIVQVALDIEETLGVHCTHNELLDASTIENQARLVESRLNSGECVKYERVTVSPEPEKLYEPFALTDVQQAYLLGRGDSFILGGVSNHGYFEYLTKLDIPRFEAALNRVIVAQPMLRCVMVDEQHQRILPELHYTIDTIDAREKSQAEIDSIRQNIREEMSHKVMDAYVCPMFQFKALRITDDESLLFFSIDLLIMDASSVRIFKDQLMEAYSHPENQLPNTDFSFRDFVTGLEHIKNSSTYLKDESYWKGRAKDFSTEATLPLLKPMNQVKKPRYSRLAFKIDTPTWGRLKRTISEHSISPSAVLCTLYLATVAHYSNQESCTVTMTVFNRYDFHPDVDKIIGDFTSTMLIHADFKKNGFWDIAKTVGKDIMEGLEHRAYSGISFTKDLRQAGVLSSKQSIPIVFTSILNNGTEHATMDFGEEQYSVSQTSQVYLDCQTMEINGSLSITWDYVSELLDPTMVNEMFKNFENAIRSIESNEPLNHFENGSVAELVKAYNHTDTYIPCRTLHGAFRNSVTQYPESIAVTDELGSMTYTELDTLSDRVASYLVAKGVQHGDNVGVLAERHKETIAEMLGILKLGAVYVPVDPNNPQARQEQILKDANCVLCLNNDVIPQLPTEVSYTPIYDNYCDTAYIIYTSGSTGKPKGVVISHDAVCNTIQDINARFNVSNTDVTIGLSSMCFDLSVYDIFGTLASGGELVIVPNIHDMHHVAELVESKSVTIWNSVPAIMQMYVEVAKRQTTQNSTLRLVMLSGDYIPLTLPDDIKQCCCNTEVISLGGATEASIWSIYYPINEVNPEWKTIPYGMPLANQKFYVLNYDLSLTPAEVEGELYIGGRGLASSYYADPQKTESAYIVHSQLGRLYRTGDFGKFHADGYIEFIGRKDSQVKIRGHRIELGEVESGILKADGLNSAVAVVNKSHSTPTLVAYVTANTSIDVNTLKNTIKQWVPSYMVPSTIVQLDSIPITSNGKVDRKYLETLDLPEVTSQTEDLPITPTQQYVMELWHKYIDGLDNLSIDSDFYEVGGDSVVLFKIVTDLEENYHTKVDVNTMMEFETVLDMANFVDSLKGVSNHD